MATCYSVRDGIVDRFIRTQEKHGESKTRRVYYLVGVSDGQLLNSNLYNTEVFEPIGEALSGLGFELDDLFEEEHDMGLGNGGLGPCGLFS